MGWHLSVSLAFFIYIGDALLSHSCESIHRAQSLFLALGATSCKFLGAELKILGAQLQILGAPTPKE